MNKMEADYHAEINRLIDEWYCAEYGIAIGRSEGWDEVRMQQIYKRRSDAGEQINKLIESRDVVRDQEAT